jgi:small conductance mechanosensitive channel
MDLSHLSGKIYELLAVYGMNVVGAVVIFVVGRWVARGVANLIRRLMIKGKTDDTLVSFVGSLSYVALLSFIVIASLNQLGIQTASFVAVLGAAGLAVGLALQGSLSNFAAGVLMIIFKPFKVGDYIEGAGTEGVVEEIQIFTTQLKTFDNKTIIVPNSKMTGNNIVNHSLKTTRRVDLVFAIAYNDDIDKARRVILEVLGNENRVRKEPEPVVVVSELADSRVKITSRAWTSTGDYWDVYFGTIEAVKKQFDAQGIRVPVPQLEVRLPDSTGILPVK